MICREGIVGAATTKHRSLLRPVGGLPRNAMRSPGVPWLGAALVAVVVAAVLAIVVGRAHIPPLAESDYCYQLIAADRFVSGHGLTCPKPAAPFQPWEWTQDWAFLTRWPVGYSILVAALRKSFGLSTLEACRWISIAACATALVGWFLWIRRTAPQGLGGWVVSAVGACAAVSVAALVNPSTDALLAAGLPIVMLLAICGIESSASAPRKAHAWLAAAGLAAGGLFWIRYAAIFVPAAIGAFLLLASGAADTSPSPWRRRAGRSVTFASCAAAGIVGLLLLNHTQAAGETTTAQLNLGTRMGFDWSVSRMATAWWLFTDLGYYDHRPSAHWVYALLPVGVLVLAWRRRGSIRESLAAPAAVLSACVVLAALLMLIAASTLFSGKFDYVGLERYYVPIRPLYFALFLAPLFWMRVRVVSAAACVALLIAGSWTVQQDWLRMYARWANAERPATPYGQWSRCFEPGAGELYQWLREQDDERLVVVSNFSEYVTLETGVPAVPIPPDPAALERWLTEIRAARGVSDLRVLFVLDPDNKWRSAWIPPPADVIREFDLAPAAHGPSGGYVFEFSEGAGREPEAVTALGVIAEVSAAVRKGAR